MPIMQSWRAIFLIFLGFGLGIPPALAQSLQPSQTSVPSFPSPVQRDCALPLQSQIASILAQPTLLRSHWGILVKGADPSFTYLAHNSDQFFTPASNVKLWVTAAALQRLGPDFRISTSIYRISAPSQPVELVIKGQGDPTFTDTQLQQLAQQLSQKGIQHIHRLWADTSAIQGPIYQGTWALEDVAAGEITPLTSLILNRNASALKAIPQALGQPLRLQWTNSEDAPRWQMQNRTLTVASTAPEFVEMQGDLANHQLIISGALREGSEPEIIDVPVQNPTANFLGRFQKALTQQGISVGSIAALSDAKSDPIPAEWDQKFQDPSAMVATVNSPRLQHLIKDINQQSHNFYAEALLRVLGSQVKSPSTGVPLSSAERGLEVVRATLTALGVQPEGYRLVDGSGLSRQNLISPAAMVQLLQAMAKTPHAKIFQASLAQAGVSGTLSNRFRESEAAGRVWGKTGTLSGIAALSGLALSSDSTPLYFSILANQSEQGNTVIRQAIDQMVLLFLRLGHCQP